MAFSAGGGGGERLGGRGLGGYVSNDDSLALFLFIYSRFLFWKILHVPICRIGPKRWMLLTESTTLSVNDRYVMPSTCTDLRLSTSGAMAAAKTPGLLALPISNMSFKFGNCSPIIPATCLQENLSATSKICFPAASCFSAART